MIYGVLGELEVRHPRTDQPLTLPAGRPLHVLAGLMVRPNHKLPHAELLRMGWGGSGVQEAQLHKAVSALRTLLRGIGREADLVTHPRFGYELKAGPGEHDLVTFERLVGGLDGLSTDQEIDVLHRALRLWRGAPLSNLQSPPFEDVVHRLGLRRKRVAVRYFDLRFQQGDHEAMLGDLQEIAEEFPTDHKLHELLIRTLYECGHGSEGIEVYDRYAHRHAEETGEPDTGLRTLAYQLSRSSQDVAAALPARGTHATPRELPAAPADFVGRQALLAELSWQLAGDAAYRVLVVPGPGGIGKTALALRAAHACRADYPDGQLWAELRGTTTDPATPGEILAQFLRSLDVPVVPESPGERAALFRSMLAERRMLIVLDDAADGAQVLPLLPAGDGCKVLVTARRRLPDVHGAHHVGTLEPLGAGDAATLFESIVAASRIDLSAEREAVRDVVSLCGGLPLALRIAAVLRVHDDPLPTAELARRLRQHGPEAYESGSVSLARTLETGLAPLPVGHRRLFTDLGLLTAPTFGAWTAAALSDDPEEGRAALAGLHAASMVEVSPAPLPRYRFHDLTREYAFRRAQAQRPDPDNLLARVCVALLGLVRHAHAQLCGGDYEVVHSEAVALGLPRAAYAEVEADPTAWFLTEQLTIRAAVQLAARLGLAAVCWDLAVSAHEFYTREHQHDDWHETHQVALAACRAAGDRRGEGMVLACLGQPALVAGGHRDGVSGVPELTQAVELLADEKELHGLAIAQRTLGNAWRRRGAPTRALALFREALDGYEAAGDPVGCAQTLRFMGQVHLDRHEIDAAGRVLTQAEQAAALLGSRMITQARYWSGCARLEAGDLPGAEAAFADVSTAAGKTKSQVFAYAAHGLGELARARGDHAQAGRHLRTAVALARDHADALLEGRVHLSLAALRHAQAEPRAEADELRLAARCFAGCDAAYLEVRAQGTLARLCRAQGQQAAATAAWARVETLYAEGEVPEEDRTERPV